MVIIERLYSLTRLVETDADGILQKGVIATLTITFITLLIIMMPRLIQHCNLSKYRLW